MNLTKHRFQTTRNTGLARAGPLPLSARDKIQILEEAQGHP